MRQALPNHLLHNPFCNRFNDPVTQRHDEMQSSAYMVWLRERNEGWQTKSNAMYKQTENISNAVQLTPGTRVFSSIFALLFILLVSLFVLLRTV